MVLCAVETMGGIWGRHAGRQRRCRAVSVKMIIELIGFGLAGMPLASAADAPLGACIGQAAHVHTAFCVRRVIVRRSACVRAAAPVRAVRYPPVILYRRVTIWQPACVHAATCVRAARYQGSLLGQCRAANETYQDKDGADGCAHSSLLTIDTA